MHIAAISRWARNILGVALLGRLTAIVFLSVSMASSVWVGAAQAQSYNFSTIQIEGNDRVDPASILSFAGIGRGQAVSAGDLNDAYQRISASGLFETIEILPNGRTLLIRVKEFPTINIINFEGNRPA